MKNKYDVPLRQWRKWCVVSRGVFNEMYFTLRHNQETLLHLEQHPMSAKKWKTVAWNAAWLAADACENSLKTIAEG